MKKLPWLPLAVLVLAGLLAARLSATETDTQQFSGAGLPNSPIASVPIYSADQQQSALRAGITGADGMLFAQIGGTLPRTWVPGDTGTVTSCLYLSSPRQTVNVTGHFSSSGANAVVIVVPCYYDQNARVFYPSKASAATTLTALTANLQDRKYYYVSATSTFNATGANAFFFYVVSISAGTLDLWCGAQ